MDERAALEVRIQMGYPAVFMDIDRLKAEAELRFSIFWPLLGLIALLGIHWSPWTLILLPLPVMLSAAGRMRRREAEEKTWAPVVAGQVSTPYLDAMNREEEYLKGSRGPAMQEVVPWLGDRGGE